MKKLLALTVVLFAMFVTACASKDDALSEDVYVTMDMNPSIAVIIDGDEKVTLATPMNEDGELLLLNLDIIGLNIEVAIELIINEAAELGFIDPEVETVIEIDVLGILEEVENRIRNKVGDAIENEFQLRELPVQVRERVYDPEFVAEAASKGLTAREYRLAQMAVQAQPDLSLEEAVQLRPDELIARVRENGENLANMVQEVKDAFLTAKTDVLDTYLPQIQALEALIEEALENEEDTTDLEAQLVALKQDMHDELRAVVDDFVTQSQALRDALETEHQNRKNTFEDRVPPRP
ncbi:MAG: hypothetical protein EA375_03660 [Acholeplasmataceae bacterium]|nr:MAG: hypothetical protein EA375_03660 [Acholeplasmataceae bacterium]